MESSYTKKGLYEGLGVESMFGGTGRLQGLLEQRGQCVKRILGGWLESGMLETEIMENL